MELGVEPLRALGHTGRSVKHRFFPAYNGFPRDLQAVEGGGVSCFSFLERA